MIDATPQLISLLNSTDKFLMADLYTITTKAGQMLKYTSADVDIFLNGTVNLLPQAVAECSSISNFSADAGSTLSIDNSTAWQAAGCLKCVTNGSGAFGCYYSTAGVTISSSTIYSASLWVKGSGTIIVTVRAYPSFREKAQTVTLTNEWQQVKLEGLISGSSDNIARIIMRYSAAYEGTFWIDGLQLEQKSFCTPWVIGTRNDYGPFSSALPITRGSTRQTRGIEVDDLSVTFYPSATDLIGSIPFIEAVGKGMLDGATFTLERAFFAPAWQNLVGSIVRFIGRIEDIEDYTRTEIPVTVKSDLVLLDVQMPRNIYQPSCRRTLYDAGCTVSKAAFGVTNTALAGSTTTLLNNSLAQVAGWFDLGTVTFTSGQNTGVSRTVKAYSPGVIRFALPLPYAPAAGDTFTAYAGCNRKQDTCSGKFSNLINFSGEPFVPAAETAY